MVRGLEALDTPMGREIKKKRMQSVNKRQDE